MNRAKSSVLGKKNKSNYIFFNVINILIIIINIINIINGINGTLRDAIFGTAFVISAIMSFYLYRLLDVKQ